jgi:hypothetical protein
MKSDGAYKSYQYNAHLISFDYDPDDLFSIKLVVTIVGKSHLDQKDEYACPKVRRELILIYLS